VNDDELVLDFLEKFVELFGRFIVSGNPEQ
jgi:hypothetical protein